MRNRYRIETDIGYVAQVVSYADTAMEANEKAQEQCAQWDFKPTRIFDRMTQEIDSCF